MGFGFTHRFETSGATMVDGRGFSKSSPQESVCRHSAYSRPRPPFASDRFHLLDVQLWAISVALCLFLPFRGRNRRISWRCGGSTFLGPWLSRAKWPVTFIAPPLGGNIGHFYSCCFWSAMKQNGGNEQLGFFFRYRLSHINNDTRQGERKKVRGKIGRLVNGGLLTFVPHLHFHEGFRSLKFKFFATSKKCSALHGLKKNPRFCLVLTGELPRIIKPACQMATVKQAAYL